jgi:Sulfotransferase family
MDYQPSRRTLRRRVGNQLWDLSALLPHTEWRRDEYRRVYLYHVRKTAGTSVAFAFMRLAGADPYLIEKRLSRFAFAQANGCRYVAHNEELIHEGNYFFAFSHVPAYVVEPPNVGTFRFTVLRDPIDRVVSLYRYLACPDADSSFSLTARMQERRWAMEGFDRFLDQLPPYHLTNQLHMFSRSASVNEAVDYLSKLDTVLHTERLDRDLSRLQKDLNLQFSLGRERPSLLPFVPTPAQRDRLNDLLRPEFEMLRQIDTGIGGALHV